MNELIATQAINEAANAFESFVNGEASTDAAGVKEKKSKKDKKRKDKELDSVNGEVAGDVAQGQEEPSKKKHKKSKKHANEGIEQQVRRKVSWQSIHHSHADHVIFLSHRSINPLP